MKSQALRKNENSGKPPAEKERPIYITDDWANDNLQVLDHLHFFLKGLETFSFSLRNLF